MQDTAGLMVGWTRLQQQTGAVQLHLCEVRLPVDASERTTEKMLEAAIGKWLRWQTGRGGLLVSDVRADKMYPTLDTRSGRLIEGSWSRRVTGYFEYRGTNAANN